MPSKTKPKATKRKDEDKKSQRERFIEAARAIGVDEDQFKKALTRIVTFKKTEDVK